MTSIEKETMDIILELYPKSNGKISEISIISENYLLIKNINGKSNIYTLLDNKLYILNFGPPEDEIHSDKFRQIFRQIKLNKIVE